MLPDLRAKFLPRFVAGARERLARARKLLASGEAAIVVTEMHASAGEAGMLEFTRVAEVLSAAEAAVRRWQVKPSDAGLADLEQRISAAELELNKLASGQG